MRFVLTVVSSKGQPGEDGAAEGAHAGVVEVGGVVE